VNHEYKSTKLNKNTQPAELKKLEAAVRKVKGVQNVIARAGEGCIEVEGSDDLQSAQVLSAAKSAGFPLQATATQKPQATRMPQPR
jgi:hypothetical protein